MTMMDHARSSLNVFERAKGRRLRLVHVEEKYKDLLYLDNRDMLLKKLVGEKRQLRILNWMIEKKVTHVIVYLWIFATVMTPVALMGRKYWFSPIVALGVVPLGFLMILYTLLISNVDIIRILLQTFEVAYLLFMGTTAAVTGLDVFKYDYRCVPVAFVLLSLGMMLILDANYIPQSKKKTGILLWVIVIPVLIFLINAGFFDDIQTSTLELALSNHQRGMKFVFNTSDIMQQSLVLCWLFLIKFWFNLVWFPDCLILMRARLKVEKLDQKQAEDCFPNKLVRISGEKKGASSLGFHLLSKEVVDNDKRIHFIAPYDDFIEPAILSSNETLAQAIHPWLGKISYQMMAMFYPGIVFGIMWGLGAIIGLLTWLNKLKEVVAIGLAIEVPFLLLGILSSNIHVLSRLLKSFEVLYNLGNLTLWFIAMGDFFGWDVRLYNVVMSIFSITTTQFFDAFHPGARNFKHYGTLFGAIYIFVVQCFHVAGLYEDAFLKTYTFKFMRGESTFQNLTFADQRFSIVLAFLIKNIYNAYMRRSCFVILRAQLCRRYLKVSEVAELLEEWKRKASDGKVNQAHDHMSTNYGKSNLTASFAAKSKVYSAQNSSTAKVQPVMDSTATNVFVFDTEKSNQ